MSEYNFEKEHRLAKEKGEKYNLGFYIFGSGLYYFTHYKYYQEDRSASDEELELWEALP